MRFFSIIFILTLFFATPSFSEGSLDKQTFCRVLPAYQTDRGVEYQPGLDVHGRPVVSADINDGQGLRNFESIEIPVMIDLIEKFGLSVPAGIELKPTVALISIHNDGRVDYNGQDISKQAHILCNEGHDDEQTGPAKPE